MRPKPPPAAVGAPYDRRQIAIIFSGILIGLFLSALDQTMVATALPRIAGGFGALDKLPWVVTSYLLAVTAVTPLYGKLGDLFGRKRILQIAVVIFLIGTILCASSQTMWQLIAFRAIQGIGSGGMVALLPGIIGDVVPPRERGKYQGLVAGTFTVANAAGPLIGGFVTDVASWRWIFIVNVPVGLVTFAIMSWALPASARPILPNPKLDFLGAFLLVGMVVCVLMVVSLGGTRIAWSSATAIALIVGSVVFLTLFIAQEMRTMEPVLPPRLFVNPVFPAAIGAVFFSAMATLSSITFMPLYLQIVYGLPPAESGLVMVPLMLGILSGSVTSGQIVSRTGRYKFFPLIGLSIGTACFLTLSRFDASTPPSYLAGTILLLGLGLGMIFPVAQVAVQNAVAARDMGVATSSVAFFRSMGGAIGAAALGALLTASALGALVPELRPIATAGPAALPSLPPDTRATLINAYLGAFHDVFLIGACLTAAGFISALFIRELPLRTTLHGREEKSAAAEAEVTEP
jgi:EmrB/QacA subfamily drug resistance transporter